MPSDTNPSQVAESYSVSDGTLSAKVRIYKDDEEHVWIYAVDLPHWKEGTEAFLEDIRTDLLKHISISTQEALNLKMLQQLKAKFIEQSQHLILQNLPHLSEKEASEIAQRITQDMLGLGEIEFLLHDDMIEEISVNGPAMPIWIYHRKRGWMRTNLSIPSDAQVWNYSSSIARGVGRQINTQVPLLDAYLASGDRVNATLFPISHLGNTITIRKFARKPWTITDYLRDNTLSADTAALLWLAMQYEANMLVCGGTGAGKTSLLNVMAMFIPPNQRVVSIEQTREITLPAYMQWVPLVVRESTSEGKGGVGMLDLMVNSLRMRPDRIIVGEVRKKEEAQVLFEAMHTGHSVYATLHAETVDEAVRRLGHEPINIPSVMLESLHVVVSMYRDRRKNIRRLFEVGEVLVNEHDEVVPNLLYRWRSFKDALTPAEPSARLLQTIKTYTNMDDAAIDADLKQKAEILNWLAAKNINSVEEVGAVFSTYYDDEARVLERVRGR